MIQIKNPIECCGCNGCVQVCPKSCISFDEDREGFRYPLVDLDKCIRCGLCEKVCPVLNPSELPATEPEVFAAINEDDRIRRESSSGGVFTAIAEEILAEGGVVFGAKYDENWEVCHGYVETKEDLKGFRGSKYMQSRIGSSYKDTLKFLKEGRKVLFTGTPCQIAGLKRFLRKDYENLYTVDSICHGVPSAKVWRMYLADMVKRGEIKYSKADITKVGFREKLPGWLNSKVEIKSKDAEYAASKNDDPYFVAFIRNVTLRPICYQCPFKAGKSGSDLTMADFWGIRETDPEMFDDKGTSMIIRHNGRIQLPSAIRIKEEETSVVGRCNPSYYVSPAENGNRKLFFDRLDKDSSVISLMQRCSRPSFIQRISNKIYRSLHK